MYACSIYYILQSNLQIQHLASLENWTLHVHHLTPNKKLYMYITASTAKDSIKTMFMHSVCCLFITMYSLYVDYSSLQNTNSQ